MAPIPRLRKFAGPALFSYGFRPFFLFGAIQAGAAMLVWLPMFYGELAAATAFAPRDWHVHEMLYGYVPAIVTGFLLTAIPNWTGRLPLQGVPLLTLVIAWFFGRLAVTVSAWSGWLLAAVVDTAFLVLVAAAAAREIIAGRNWRNLKVVTLLVVLAAGNAGFHLEAHLAGLADYSMRLGIAAAIALIMVIGGRIIPSFTRNWLAGQGAERMPTPFGRFDMIAIAAGVTALALWTIFPEGAATGPVLLCASVLQTVRWSRWAGERTARERLVLILHVGFAFVPLGFLLAGLAAFGLVTASAGTHAWTVGAVGTMTLAVMSRASLGHAGRQLTANAGTQLIYAAVVISALSRIWAALAANNEFLLHVAAFAWVAAFLGFAALYAPALCAAKR